MHGFKLSLSSPKSSLVKASLATATLSSRCLVRLKAGSTKTRPPARLQLLGLVELEANYFSQLESQTYRGPAGFKVCLELTAICIM